MGQEFEFTFNVSSGFLNELPIVDLEELLKTNERKERFEACIMIKDAIDNNKNKF